MGDEIGTCDTTGNNRTKTGKSDNVEDATEMNVNKEIVTIPNEENTREYLVEELTEEDANDITTDCTEHWNTQHNITDSNEHSITQDANNIGSTQG